MLLKNICNLRTETLIFAFCFSMKKSALFRLHFIVFLWGFTAILGKLISANAQVLVFYRMLFAALFLLLFAVFVQRSKLKVSGKLALQLVTIGGVMAFHWLCFFHSIKVSNVAIALSCLSLSTLFVSLLEPLIYKRKIDLSEIVMGIVIVASMVMIFKVELHYLQGILFGIAAAVGGAIFSVFNGKLYGKTSSTNIILYEIGGGWLLMSLFFLATGELAQVNEISFRDLALITLLAAVFTAYPMLQSVNLMKYISPFTLVLTVNLEPVYGILMAFFIFGESEKMSTAFYVASLLMIVAIAVNGILKSRKQNRQLTERQ